MKPGKFIVFEGLDGCGKTTQIKRLTTYLTEKNIPCCFAKNPSDSRLGALARHYLKSHEAIEPRAFALLFAADRADHMQREIRPALAQGIHVLCDRFVYSNMAFQGVEVSLAEIAAYNEAAISAAPDITLFLDTAPEACIARIKRSRTELEVYDSLEYAEKVRVRYFEAFDLLKPRMPVQVVDGNDGPEEVFGRLAQAVNNVLL